MLPPPAPWAAVALTVALVSWVYGARQFILHHAVPWRLAPFGPTTLVFGLTVAGLLVPFAVVARFSGSVDLGLTASAMAGLALALGGRRVGWSASSVPSGGGPRAAPRRAVLIAVLVLQVGLLALYGYLSWRYQMHDEHAVFGHKSMVEQLRRDAYPLYYPSLPGQEARYHYGFDLLAGAMARAYALSSDVAIDVVGLALVAFMGFAAAAVVSDEGAERSAPLAVLAVHFGAGLAFVLLAGVDGRHPRCLTQYHHPTCNVELFPTQFLNVFQHPVAVGVPMFLAFALVAPRLAGASTRWMAARADAASARADAASARVDAASPRVDAASARVEAASARADADSGKGGRGALAILSVLLLGGLAIGQFVYFALGVLAALASLLVAPPARADGPSRRAGALMLLAVSVVGLGLAALEGGMLARNPSIDPNLVGLRGTPGFPKGEPLTGILWHHAVNLGLGFLLLPLFLVVALRRRRPQVALLTAFAIGGVLVAHLFFYSRSWDIVKFPSAAAFALSLLYVAVVDDRLADWARRAGPDAVRGTVSRWGRRFGAALLMGTGITAATFVTFPLAGPLRLYDVGRWQGDGLVRQTIQWWRINGYDSREVIFAQSNVAKELSVFGGLSVVAEDADLYYMGLDMKVLRAQRRQAARIKAQLDPQAMQALGVRWLMFSDEELRNLGPVARKKLSKPTPGLTVVATFDGPTPVKRRRIWRVDP